MEWGHTVKAVAKAWVFKHFQLGRVVVVMADEQSPHVVVSTHDRRLGVFVCFLHHRRYLIIESYALRRLSLVIRVFLLWSVFLRQCKLGLLLLPDRPEDMASVRSTLNWTNGHSFDLHHAGDG